MVNKKKIIFITEIIIILFFLFTIGSGVFVSPFMGDVNMIDEGQFGAWVSHMLRGEFLYKDTYSAYGPFYIYPLYLLSKIFGPSVLLIRIVYIVLNAFLTVLITRTILAEFKIPYVLKVSTLAFLLFMPNFGMRQGIGLLAIFLFYKALDKNRWAFSIFSGLALSASYLTSFEIGIFATLSVSVLYLIKFISVKKLDQLLTKFLLVILSFAIVIIPFGLWAGSEGWLGSYLSTVVDDLTSYSGVTIPIGKAFPNAISLLPKSLYFIDWVKYFFSKEILLYWVFLFYIVTFSYLTIKFISKKSEANDLLKLTIAIYGFLISYILIGRSGHFTFALPPIFIILATYYNDLLLIISRNKNPQSKIIAILLISLISFMTIRIILIYRPNFPRISDIPNSLNISSRETISYLGPITISNKQKKEIITVQNIIKKSTSTEDNVFFFGNEPMMYMLVNRGSPSRFDLPEVAVAKEKRLEIVNDLKKDNTKLIIDNTNAWAVDEVSNRQRLPEVIDYIEKNYIKQRVGQFIIYKIKS